MRYGGVLLTTYGMVQHNSEQARGAMGEAVIGSVLALCITMAFMCAEAHKLLPPVRPCSWLHTALMTLTRARSGTW